MSASPNRLFIEAYLDKVQADNPAVAGEEARQVLRAIYDKVAEASYRVGSTSTALKVYTALRGHLLSDLDFISKGGLTESFLQVLRDDSVTTLHEFLSTIYGGILEQVCVSGGIPVITAPGQPDARPQRVRNPDPLTAAEELMLNNSPRGKA